jgi:hypothetical protein
MTDERPAAPMPQFEPLRRASRARVVAAMVFGPVLWLAALVVGARTVERTDAVEIGLLIAAASFAGATVVLATLRWRRRREERRYADPR